MCASYCSTSSSEELKRLYLVREYKNYLFFFFGTSNYIRSFRTRGSRFIISAFIGWWALREASDLPRVTYVSEGDLQSISTPCTLAHMPALGYGSTCLLVSLHATVKEILRITHWVFHPVMPTSASAFVLSRNHVIHPLQLPFHTEKPPSQTFICHRSCLPSFRVSFLSITLILPLPRGPFP